MVFLALEAGHGRHMEWVYSWDGTVLRGESQLGELISGDVDRGWSWGGRR